MRHPRLRRTVIASALFAATAAWAGPSAARIIDVRRDR